MAVCGERGERGVATLTSTMCPTIRGCKKELRRKPLADARPLALRHGQGLALETRGICCVGAPASPSTLTLFCTDPATQKLLEPTQDTQRKSKNRTQTARSSPRAVCSFLPLSYVDVSAAALASTAFHERTGACGTSGNDRVPTRMQRGKDNRRQDRRRDGLWLCAGIGRSYRGSGGSQSIAHISAASNTNRRAVPCARNPGPERASSA